MSLRMKCPPDYDLLKSVHSWKYPEIEPTPEITGKLFLGRQYSISGEIHPVLIEQRSPGSSLQVTHSSGSSGVSSLRDILSRVLGFSVDTTQALYEISRDPIINSVASGVKGIRPYQSPTAFEALAKSVIQQQVSYRAASAVTRRLVLELGSVSELSDLPLYSFPSATQILRAGESRLRSIGLGYRAPYLLNVCNLEIEGELETESLRRMPYSELLELLKPVRGIGEWTIQALSIAGLGNFGVFPYGDLAMRNLLGRLYLSGRRMTAQEVRAKADEWRDGPLVLYLLMCAEVLGFFRVGPPEND